MITEFCLSLAFAFAAAPPSPGFAPDPASVEREGPAYRYPQAGWIVLHVEGEPYERGFQHGKLLASEIAAYVRCYASMQAPRDPTAGWALTRTLANALFTRRIEPEYLEELKGIADGAAAGGARWDRRPVDLTDVVAINVWPEVMTLDGALEATPTGLEGRRYPRPEGAQPPPPVQALRCSAFAATGPATRDGKAIIGHITMFALYSCNFFNVWVDLKPAKGHRVLYQTSPGGIQSGLDYYLNDAGLVLCETTIRQTRFNAAGASLGSQSRRAMQYADSIDAAVAIFLGSGNGLYANEWLLADTKTNEIALFELGTRSHKLLRSSRNEWFGGTEGFYWGCNNAKDLDVRLETLASTADRPADLVFVPSERDRRWVQLYREHRGKIDAEFGKLAFTQAPIAYHSSCDAKFTTTDLAGGLRTWARFGPPLGRSWRPTPRETENFPDIRPLVANPWTILGPEAPPSVATEEAALAVDLGQGSEPRPGRGRRGAGEEDGAEDETDFAFNLRPEPAWRGTLLPAADRDVWLTTAFAELERYAAREKSLRREKNGKNREGKALSENERDRLSLLLVRARSEFIAASRASGGGTPLSRLVADVSSDRWHSIARGRGVHLLNDLRQRLGAEEADRFFDTFGTAHAGGRVTGAEFIAEAGKAAGEGLEPYFRPWLEGTDLPALKIAGCKAEKVQGGDSGPDAKEGYCVAGELAVEGEPLPSRIEVTVELEGGEKTASFPVSAGKAEFSFELEKKPLRVVADKYGLGPWKNGGAYLVSSFFRDLAEAVIVYGTRDEEAANREAAEELQKAIVERGTNFTVPVRADSSLTEEEIAARHLILIGRPDANSLTERLQGELPVKFGRRSFTVRGKTYAHQESAVIAAGENPRNRRYSIVAAAGLSAAATFRAAPIIAQRISAPVRILPAHDRPRDLAPPPAELVREIRF
jgi:hypothetical protein